MNEDTQQRKSNQDAVLHKEEAASLAIELQKILRQGNKPSADIKLIKKLISGLGDKRGLIRRTFSEILGLIGKDALPELTEALLNSKNVTARRAAAKTLRLVGDPNALPDLLQALLNDPDPVVQGSAVGAMAVFGEDAAKYLLEVINDSNTSEMQCGLASWGLSFIGAKGAQVLKKAAISNNAKVRASAIAALGEPIQSQFDEEAKNIVSSALNDSSDEVQIEAMKLISSLEDQDWDLKLLATKLAHKNPQIRKQSALSLMKLNAISQTEMIRQALAIEKDSEVINIINLSLNKLKKQL